MPHSLIATNRGSGRRLFAGLAVLLLGTVAANAGSPTAWYRFNTGPNGAAVQSAIDSGPNGLTGAVTGDLYYSSNRTPRGGGRFSLNATADYDYTATPDASALDPTGSFDLSAWAYPTGGQNPDGIGDSIANKHESPESGVCIISYSISYNASTGQYYAEICNSTNTNNPEVIVASTDTFALNQWHFVEMKFKYAAQRQKAELSLYVDGKLEGSQSLTGFSGIYYSAGPFQIGAENSGPDGDHDFYRRNFYGYIDEVKLTAK